MSDFVQKLDMKRADYPKKIPVSGFGERKCNYEGTSWICLLIIHAKNLPSA
jgi:hypothetical protein